jgi:hypothetical protein
VDKASKAFKSIFSHMCKLGLLSPWTKDPRLLGAHVYEEYLISCPNNVEVLEEGLGALS